MTAVGIPYARVEDDGVNVTGSRCPVCGQLCESSYRRRGRARWDDPDGREAYQRHYALEHLTRKIMVDALKPEYRPDPCPRCGGDHDRIDRREPCPPQQQVLPW